jgi:DNA polymerase-3 subunit alpha
MYLNCHSYYSLRYGTFSENDLITLAQTNGVTHLGLTDINCTSAVLSFIKNAQLANLNYLVGIDVRNGNKPMYLLLAKTNDGFCNINTFLSEYVHEKKDFPVKTPNLQDVFVVYSFDTVLEYEFPDFKENEFIGISIANINKLKFSKYKEFTDKLIVQQPVTFRSQTDFNAHRLLRSIDLNCLLSKLPLPEQGTMHDKMHSQDFLENAFADFTHILKNTKRIFDSCNVHFTFEDERQNQNKLVYSDSQDADFELLKKLCFDKVHNRYKVINKVILDRIEKELQAIKNMHFVSYFLINYDLLQYAKSKNYPYIGRGSGANSVVAYIIGITNVDPIELDLYFERFINIYRTSPPDFDLDFSWRDRDDVTNYIFNRHKNVALMGTYVTFQYRAVIRELGKVFGVPKAEIDNFIRGSKTEKENDSYFQLIAKYSGLIHGLPNYLSVHSGGIIITEKPIHYYTATFLPPKGFATVMIDMNIAEDVGIYKYDILAQRGLSKIKDALHIISYNQPNAKVADLEDIEPLKTNPDINNLLKNGDCMGVFYVESPAMRTLMIKLQTDNYLNLVAASSIIRPGVSTGGMKNEFILRHRDVERRKLAHPVLNEILADTYGVMVYQEDVMKVSHRFAGLSLGESDILRRGMRGKVKSKAEFENIEQKFLTNCKEKGYEDSVINEVWNQIKAFGGYAFAKGHSASYAVESYQSLYLKLYFPLEFMTAVLNNGGGFYNIETYLAEFRRYGGMVQEPCVNFSCIDCKLYDKTMYLGFELIQNLESRTMQKIVKVRTETGMFTDFDDFLDRVKISLEQVVVLIRINAFRFTKLNKHELHWMAHFKHKNMPINDAPRLFALQQQKLEIPKIEVDKLVDSYDQMELLGFPLCNYFDLLQKPVHHTFKATDLKNNINNTVVIYGRLITAKPTPTSKKEIMHFGTFYDCDGNVFDTVHFPEVAKKHSMKHKGIYKIQGKVSEELGVFSILVEDIALQEIQVDPRYCDGKK